MEHTEMENTQMERPSLPRLFRKTEGLLHQYVGTLSREAFDPERGQGRILALLKKTGPLTQRDLAYLLGIRPQSLGELVRKLEDNGYVVREQQADDKRSMVVSLTEQGSALELQRSPMEQVFACLNEEEQDTLRTYLERLCAQVEELLPEDVRAANTGRCGREERWGCRPPFGPERPHEPGPGPHHPCHGPGPRRHHPHGPGHWDFSCHAWFTAPDGSDRC